MIAMKFTGGQEIAKTLAALPQAVSRKVQIQALTAGAGIIQRRAASLAPRDENAGPPHLADNIVISVPTQAQLERRERFTETVVEVGPARKPDDVFYGYFQEFGTAHHPAQPFMRPAFDEGAPISVNLVISEFWQAIRRFLGTGTGRSTTGRGV